MHDRQIAHHLVDTLPRTVRYLRMEFQKHIPKDMTMTQFRIICHLDMGRMNITDIANITGMSLPATSRLISQMEEKKWIERIRDNSNDRRQVDIVLSENGRTLYKKLQYQSENSIIRKLDSLNEDEKKQLKTALTLLSKVTS